MSPDQFGVVTQSQLAHIAEVQQSLYEVCVPFKEKGDIRPIQYKKATDALAKLDEYIQEFVTLLDKTAHLSAVVSALRYPLLVKLSLFGAQINELIYLIDNDRITSSQQTLRQRKKICESFEALSHSASDISQQAIFLNDEILFRERSLQMSFKEGIS